MPLAAMHRGTATLCWKPENESLPYVASVSEPYESEADRDGAIFALKTLEDLEV